MMIYSQLVVLRFNSKLIQILGANVAGAFLISLKLNGDKKLSKFSDNIISLANY